MGLFEFSCGFGDGRGCNLSVGGGCSCVVRVLEVIGVVVVFALLGFVV